MAGERDWTVYLVPHTHTDFGYTDLQSRVLDDHVRFIDEVLRCCDATDPLPEEARFRWTCEGTWAVERFLETRSKGRIERFLRRVAEGRIEVTAMPFQGTDLANEEELIRALASVERLRERYGIPVRTAMQNDINGYPWDLPRALRALEITWFATAINKTRSLLPFDMPTAFWWESPGGDAVLTWRGEHYHFGNELGLASSLEEAFQRLPQYLDRLAERGYPYDAVLVQVSSWHTDNSPPHEGLSLLVDEWNRRRGSPRLVMATISDWFEYLERATRDKELPRLRLAWPDWWADGNASCPAETGLARLAHETLAAAQALAWQPREGTPPDPAAFERAWRLLFLFDEHTFGAAPSKYDPASYTSIAQWRTKASFAWLASLETSSLLADAASSLSPGEGTWALALLNPLPFPPRLYAEVELPAPDAAIRLVETGSGGEVRFEPLGTRCGRLRALVDVRGTEGLAAKVIRVAPGAPPSSVKELGCVVENAFYRVEADPQTGAIASITDKRSGEELTGTGPHPLGLLVHEAAPGAGPQEVERGSRGEEPYPMTRTPAASGGQPEVERTPRRQTLRTKQACPGLDGAATLEVTLLSDEPAVRMRLALRKKRDLALEALYLALPLAPEDGQLYVDVVGGVMRPGIDQIPGSATDWHSAQRWIAASNGRRTTIVVTAQAPLFQFGGINFGQWLDSLTLEKPIAYSWLYNNYWFTNFPAYAEGELVFDYLITSAEGPLVPAEADRIARSFLTPVPCVLWEGEPALPTLSVTPGSVVATVVAPLPDGGGAVVCLRQRSGEATKARLELGGGPWRFALLSPGWTRETEPLGEGEAVEVPLPGWGLEAVKVAPLR